MADEQASLRTEVAELRQELKSSVERMTEVSRTSGGGGRSAANPDVDLGGGKKGKGALGGATRTSFDSNKKALFKMQQEAILGKEHGKGDKDGKRSRFLCMPKGRFRLCWDGVNTMLILYFAVVLPYRIAFVTSWSTGWRVVNILFNVQLLLDVLVTTRTCIELEHTYIIKPKEIVRHYARSWLTLDLLSSIPFEMGIDFNAADYALRTLLFTRLLSVARLFRYVSKWEVDISFISSNVMRLVKLCVIVSFFIHVFGCVQYFATSLDGVTIDSTSGARMLHRDSWAARANIDAQTEFVQWAWCFYHTLNQLLAMSSGVTMPVRTAWLTQHQALSPTVHALPPRHQCTLLTATCGTVCVVQVRTTELVIFLVVSILGAVLYAIFVATLTAVFTEMGAAGREYRSKMDMLRQYCRHLHMHKDLQDKLK
jgi:hypothetical protein